VARKSGNFIRMASNHQGSFRLFRLWGVDVFLHWSWFLVAYYQISVRQGSYSSVTWNVLEYLALFLIVTMHEFGHSLACRSVGGQADRIVLWPLGGIAYVAPPQRPGATLWSIAAGPLVNVVLLPILFGLTLLGRNLGWAEAGGTLANVQTLLRSILFINAGLLIFNLLPIYPLDGGQILRSLLWFPFGRARSLMIASIMGFIGVAGLIALAIWLQQVWFGVMCAFILMNCWGGLMQARRLAKLEAAARREDYACPDCQESPPRGEFWTCGKCRTKFDTFETAAVCPKCGTAYAATACSACGGMNPIAAWSVTATAPPPIPPNPYSAK
jgi:Zn-dependent protease